MYISRDSVFAKFEQMFDKSVIEVMQSLNNLKITITKQEIEDYLTSQLNRERKEIENCYGLVYRKSCELELVEKYSFNEKDYKFFLNLFNIYKSRALTLCKIVKMIAGEHEIDFKLFKDLDIVLLDEYVRYSDLMRVFIPLMRNFNLTISTKCKAEDKTTYLEKYVKVNLPKNSLIDTTLESCDPLQFVSMTDKMIEKQLS